MALDCANCEKKHDVSLDTHCSEFERMPQIDACAVFSLSPKATAAGGNTITQQNRPTGTYIGLENIRVTSVPTEPLQATVSNN